nr:nucleoside/nucleotide kinase family protein [Nocardioidaceae bacterium]
MTARPSATAIAHALLPHLKRRVSERPRFLLGLAGPPGAGKSDLANALAAVFERDSRAGTAVVVGMDGFHLH